MSREVQIGGYSYEIDESARFPYRHLFESVQIPRQDVEGDPKATNLYRDEWLWTITDFSGGEGRIVADPNDTGPPHYRTSSGIDIREPGNFKCLPSMSVDTSPADPRVLDYGADDKLWMLASDATNTDSYKWNFTTNQWDAEGTDIQVGAPLVMTHSASNQYWAGLGATINIFNDTTASTTYSSTYSASGLGLAVAADRLYGLYGDPAGNVVILAEYALDASPTVTGTTVWTSNGAATDFGGLGEYQYLTATDNGVRWILPETHGPGQVWDYSEGVARQLVLLPAGVAATAIFHYQGVTFIAGQGNQDVASGPNTQRSGIWYLDAQKVLRFLGWLRYEDPDDEPVRHMTAYGSFLYILQGNNIWCYNTSTGGLSLDSAVGAADETEVRSLAVMDTKKWVAIESQGTSVSANTYPTTAQYLYSPVNDFGVADQDKVLLGFTVITAPLGANTEVTLDYQDNEDTVWTSAGAASTSGTTHAWDVSTSSSTVKFRNLQWRVGIRSGGANTPEVRSVTTRVYVNKYLEGFELALKLGSVDRSPGWDQVQNLDLLASNENVVQFRDARVGGTRQTYDVIVQDPVTDLRADGTGTASVRLRVI